MIDSFETHFDVLVFGAHPDDAEMGMGGTVIKLVLSGKSLLYISLTHGEMGTHGSPTLRKKEFDEACRIMGCQGALLDFQDTGVENTREARIRLARIIRQTTPQLIFCPYYNNPVGELGGLNHTDHYATGALVRDAVKLARLQKTIPDLPKHTITKLYFYMVPKQINAPLYVDVSDVIDKTMQAIEAYGSQLAIAPQGLPIKQVLLTRRAAAGLDIGAAYAERFVTDLPLNLSARQLFEI
ncbi:MAG: PIG-L family deacetylase [Oligoflexia bacterium]|nr:PIG-L family deacetylase [Oligoflexia bacterium]